MASNHYSDRPGAHARKAYASLGDDSTLSRFVKVRGAERKYSEKPKQAWFKDMKNPSITAGRSIFHRRGVKKLSEVKTLLVSGHNNLKIGRDVRKGMFKGYWIYTLTLEERATCPRSCNHWETCYGGNMPYAKRIDHTDPDFLPRLEAEIFRLCTINHGGIKRTGVLIRLHALGDFFSVEYVNFWRSMLDRFSNLAIYGYTAHTPLAGDAEIYRAIQYAKTRHGRRFAIRWSNGGGYADATVPVLKRADVPAGAFLCPEQSPGFTASGKPILCATCGLCWSTSKPVAFLEH